MNKQAIAKFKLKDGTEVYVEVPKPSAGSSMQEVAIGDNVYAAIDGASGSFEAALDKVKPVAEAVMNRVVSGLTTPADEVEVKFGFTLTTDAGVLFCSVGGQATFEVTLKWQQKQQ